MDHLDVDTHPRTMFTVVYGCEDEVHAGQTSTVRTICWIVPEHERELKRLLRKCPTTVATFHAQRPIVMSVTIDDLNYTVQTIYRREEMNAAPVSSEVELQFHLESSTTVWTENPDSRVIHAAYTVGGDKCSYVLVLDPAQPRNDDAVPGPVPVCSFCVRELVYTQFGWPIYWQCVVCEKMKIPTFRWQCPYDYCGWQVCVQCMPEHLSRAPGYNRQVGPRIQANGYILYN